MNQVAHTISTPVVQMGFETKDVIGSGKRVGEAVIEKNS